MIFKREIIPCKINLTFTVQDIIENGHYTKFIKNNPSMDNKLYELVVDFVTWAGNSNDYGKYDFYYKGSCGCADNEFLIRGEWNVADKNPHECGSWGKAQK